LQECITTLPQLLVLHLNRFTVDYDNGGRVVKLNDRISFPRNISMRSFTADGLAERERVDAAGSVAHSSAATGTNDDYELVGVLVHRGTAQDGHYYSFIRDRGDCAPDPTLSPDSMTREPLGDVSRINSSGKWYRFDDASVTAFDPRDLPKETFGGTYFETVQRQRSPWDYVRTEQPILHNALMLFYERRAGGRLTASEAVTAVPASVGMLAIPQVQQSHEAERTSFSQTICAASLQGSRAALGSVVYEIDQANRRASGLAFAHDPTLLRFLSSAADDAVTDALCESGLAAPVDVAEWSRVSNDKLSKHVAEATASPPVGSSVQQAGVSSAGSQHPPPLPRRPPFVPPMQVLCPAALSIKLRQLGQRAEVQVHARVEEALARDSIAYLPPPYSLGSAALTNDGVAYLQTSAAKEKRRPGPLFRVLATFFLQVSDATVGGFPCFLVVFLRRIVCATRVTQVVTQARVHDVSSVEVARALMRHMQMQPSAARWLLYQV
jgi:hypothetical protein